MTRISELSEKWTKENYPNTPEWVLEWGKYEDLADAAKSSGLKDSKVIKIDGKFVVELKGGTNR